MCYMPNLCVVFLISQLYWEQIIKLRNIKFHYMPNLMCYMPNLCVVFVFFISQLYCKSSSSARSSLHIITLIKIVKVCFDLIPVTGFCSPIV